MSELEPHVLLAFNRSDSRVNFFVESANRQFRIYVRGAELLDLPEVDSALCDGAGFTKEDDTLTRLSSREDIHGVLLQVAQILAKLPDK